VRAKNNDKKAYELLQWGPIYSVLVSDLYRQPSLTIHLILQVLPTFCLLISIVDLFWYNHELLEYMKRKFLIYFHLNQN